MEQVMRQIQRDGPKLREAQAPVAEAERDGLGSRSGPGFEERGEGGGAPYGRRNQVAILDESLQGERCEAPECRGRCDPARGARGIR
jgi:hypothetical protein